MIPIKMTIKMNRREWIVLMNVIECNILSPIPINQPYNAARNGQQGFMHYQPLCHSFDCSDYINLVSDCRLNMLLPP